MAIEPTLNASIAQLRSSAEQAAGLFQKDAADIKKKLESTMASAAKQFDTEKLQTMTEKLVSRDLVNTTTKLGNELGDVFAGFQGLTKVADDIVPKLQDISKPLQNTMKQFAQKLPNQSFAQVAEELKATAGKIPIAQMTADVKGLTDKLVRDLESEDVKSKLTAITGKAELAGKQLLDVVVASPLPEAMSTALEKVSTDLDFKIPLDDMKAILEENIDLEAPLGQLTVAAEGLAAEAEGILDAVKPDLDNVLKSIAGDGLKLKVDIPELGDLNKIAGEFRSVAQGELGKVQQALGGGFGSLMGNVVEASFAPAANALREIGSINGVKIDIPKEIVDKVTKLKVSNNLTEAVNIMKNFSDVDESIITDKLLSINSSMSSFLNAGTPGVGLLVNSMKKFAEAFTENPNNWGNNSPGGGLKFPTIETRDAVSADIQSVKSREITSLIVVSTQTGVNEPLNAEEFSKLFYQRYKVGPPFNYLIHRSGKVEKGRPLDNKFPDALGKEYLQAGALKWYNASIVVFMVGGYNAAKGTPDIEKYAGKDAYTASQFTALNKFIAGMLQTYPGIDVYGASDIGAGAGPYFNVQQMVKAKHNKTNTKIEVTAESEPPKQFDIATATGPF